jgi:hypothetical protein
LPANGMSGLSGKQLDELESRVAEQLGEPWEKGKGRPRGLTLRQAIIVSAGYMRHNITEEVWADIFGTSQPVISRAITMITPLIEQATAGLRPSEEEAAAAVRGQSALLDGFLAPCWSWKPVHPLYSGKHKQTGFNCQLIAYPSGDVVFISDPLPGRIHDMGALKQTPAQRILAGAISVIADKGYQGSDYLTPDKKPKGGELLDWQKKFNSRIASLRAPVERAVAHIKAWRILHTDYRRPLHTYLTSFRAAIGLYFFRMYFG